jgi:2-methylcitrate dehydratase
MVAVALLKGGLTAEHYEDQAAEEPRIDELREKMRVVENDRFTRDYLDPEKRSIANAVRVFFRDGRATERVEVEYPLGHRRRRAEAIPPLRAKFERAIAARFAPRTVEQILGLFDSARKLAAMPVREFMDLWIA